MFKAPGCRGRLRPAMHLPSSESSEAEIHQLVHSFYSRVRSDELLGPVFERHIADWTPHLARMVDFWSSVLLGTRRYHGTPMPAHQALPELNPGLFRRWLELFSETTTETCSPELGARADQLAGRIAQSLWLGHQLAHAPDALPRALEDVA
jgi:hemoglobin